MNSYQTDFFANNTMSLCFIGMVSCVRYMDLLKLVDNATQLVQLITTKPPTELPVTAKNLKTYSVSWLIEWSA